MKYMVFVIDSLSNSAGGDEMAAIDSFNDRLRADGQWVTAAGIAAPGQAHLIDNREGTDIVSSGSLFDSAEYYSGFWIIDVVDSVTAMKLAKEGSRACNRRVELRPFLA